MSRALIVLMNDAERAKAVRWIGQAPENTRVEFKSPRRTLEQNSLLWALLTELSVQTVWHSQKYSPDDWKDFFLHALKHARWMPDESGGMLPIGMRSSDLSKDEMSDLIELIYEFGARNGVIFSGSGK